MVIHARSNWLCGFAPAGTGVVDINTYPIPSEFVGWDAIPAIISIYEDTYPDILCWDCIPAYQTVYVTRRRIANNSYVHSPYIVLFH